MGKKKSKGTPGALAVNRRARFEYILEDLFECGIQLTGTEVKALREGGGSFADAYVHIDDDEVWLESFHIRPYSHTSPLLNHEPVRPRRLLMHKREIERLSAAAEQKGYTIVPTRLYTKGRWLKIEIALAKGKKLHDKREAKKEQMVKRDIDRAMKGRDW